MKKSITYVDAARFAEIIARKQGINLVTQAGYVRLEGSKGRRMYVAITKRVGVVNLSGFEMPAGTDGVTDLGGESFGSVKQRLDFSKPEADILAAFELCLDHMLTLPAVEAKAKRQAKESGPKAQGWPETMVPARAKRNSELSPEEKEAKRKLMEEVAAAHGAGISQAALEELNA